MHSIGNQNNKKKSQEFSSSFVHFCGGLIFENPKKKYQPVCCVVCSVPAYIRVYICKNILSGVCKFVTPL